MGGGKFRGTSTGIIKPSTGLNYSDEWTSKIKGTGSYFYSNSRNLQEQNTLRQSFLPTTRSLRWTGRRLLTTWNQNHRINFRVEAQIDSFSSILYTPSITIQHSENFNETRLYHGQDPGLEYLGATSQRQIPIPATGSTGTTTRCSGENSRKRGEPSPRLVQHIRSK